MKLLTKTTLYFLLAMVPLLIITGYYLFSQFSKEINNRSDKELISDEIEWVHYVESQEEDGASVILKAPDLSIYPTNADADKYVTLTDISYYNAKSHTKIPYRQLSQVVSVSGTSYQILIRQSQEQKAALVTDITRIMLFVFIGLFAATLIFNWAISRQLWAPFRRSLNKIRSAELEKMQTVHFEETGTQEFNELNASLNIMTQKIYTDYDSMKEFTENAAHEMQTPIAVVQSKLELLMQDANLTEEQVKSVVQSTTALNRLSKLNQSLLLLAKIENNQYEAKENVNLTEIIRKYLLLFDAIIKDKKLTVQTDCKDELITKLHSFLADSLISNLLGNAIKYNYENGTIIIFTSLQKISISNTSLQPEIKPDNLFSRMKKDNNYDEQSTGLGLAIVKKIVDANRLHIDYAITDNIHTFTISKV